MIDRKKQSAGLNSIQNTKRYEIQIPKENIFNEIHDVLTGIINFFSSLQI
jgi:hypothetical protein